jgi:tRNA U34 5-methylaminomethyl-2-thiouridine-forming methyltransferase MnmC
MSLEVLLTKDSSHTLYVPELDETYHSRNGAVEEAMYVYIGKGLLDFINHSKTENNSSQTKEISILEIGFGTGLNAWLTAMATETREIHCLYHSMETTPLSVELITQLNYTATANDENKSLYLKLHEAEWNQTEIITSSFSLTKYHCSLQNYKPQQQFDIIYFDAFAPEKQPELWTRELFQKLYDCLKPNGTIVTYSSKGDVKRLWREIGFVVERLPGPPMKRHMLRGKKYENK